MPIQPMKSNAAVALLNGLNLVAGICAGGIMLVLGVTGLMQLVYKLVPSSVVKWSSAFSRLVICVDCCEEHRKVAGFFKI